jgi:hypothetical protein
MLGTTIVITAALAAVLPAMSAQAAGVGRTFLSAAGSDSNNCANVLTPCRHLATAFAATAQDGEIYVLDPANYGSLTITHGVSIEGHGWASIAPPAGGVAITIATNNSSDKINIIGVVLDGTALANTTGIAFDSGGTLTVRDSVIRNFAFEGINFNTNTSTPSQIFVSNTLVSDNGGNGIFIQPFGSGITNAVLNHVEIENNTSNGLEFFSPNTETINVTVSDSVSANNGGNGILLSASGTGTSINVMVRNSTIANNATGLNVSGGASSSATLLFTRSAITGNTTAWAVTGGGGILTSYGDNNINGNGSNNSTPGSAIPYH